MSTRISRQSFEFIFIRNRIELHPNATAAEIAASLELDGIKVSAERVRQVMDEIQHTENRIDDCCSPRRRPLAPHAPTRSRQP